jgi:hypothetical protein
MIYNIFVLIYLNAVIGVFGAITSFLTLRKLTRDPGIGDYYRGWRGILPFFMWLFFMMAFISIMLIITGISL